MAGKVVVPGYYLVCYNNTNMTNPSFLVVVPGYYLVCYNFNVGFYCLYVL